MLAKHFKQASILIFLKRFHYLTDIAAVTAEVELSSHFLIGTNIQLGNMNMFHYRRVFCQGSIYIFHARTVDIVMSLHADTINGHTFFLHGFHHIIDTVTLSRIGSIIVIVEKEYIRVGLTGINKGFLNELVTSNLIKGGITIWTWLLSHASPATLPATIGDSFVHHVPRIYHVFITFHDGCDVVLHILEQFLFRHKIAFFILIHPLSYLGMPHQAMPAKFDTVTTAKVGDLVGILPVELSVGRLGGLRLHVVFRRNTVKVFFDDGNLFGICDITHINSHANREVIFISILQSCFAALCEPVICTHSKCQRAKGKFE